MADSDSSPGRAGSPASDAPGTPDWAAARPVNVLPSPPFHVLISGLFAPLAAAARPGLGGRRHYETRRDILARFIARWRREVGPDIYPCLRLVLPQTDKARQMYGMKEKVIGRHLVRLLGLAPESDDAQAMVAWKVPGARRHAGDFAERCHAVLQARQMRASFGDLTVDRVNALLDDLGRESTAAGQLPILAEFYDHMNAEELKWLIRIVLRQMHIGASERSVFAAWHRDANALFAVTSSLRRVCWELHDWDYRLPSERQAVTLLECFQPQLAAFPKRDYDRVVRDMRGEPFYIEEKLDGERIQIHVADGGASFRFFSRNAKDYTYLYGRSLDDAAGALTRHLAGALDARVRSAIVDGEMVSWDPAMGAIEPFGSLKTAALAEQAAAGGSHPLFRAFDLLHLNGTALVGFPLYERRRALAAVVRPVPGRFEVHPFETARTKDDIDAALRRVIAEASEGLVIKDPTSLYRVNDRNDDWIKVKPEYMDEFGENLDVLVVGGYYGQGKRRAIVASYLCALRVDELGAADKARRFWSFCKVGGGFTAHEYAEIRHLTDGRWRSWDADRPPPGLVELAGPRGDRERPDVWIEPEHSVVLEIKAAAATTSTQFRTNFTLRFPRFRRLRPDKDWQSALSLQEFFDLKERAEAEADQKDLTIETPRRQQKRAKRELSVLHSTPPESPAKPRNRLFDGHAFYILTERVRPRKTRAQLEALVLEYGGTVAASPADAHVIADRDLVKVVSLKRQGCPLILRPAWIEDCVANMYVLPPEPAHLYFAGEDEAAAARAHVDEFGDSYLRDVDLAEFERTLDAMSDTGADADIYNDFVTEDPAILDCPGTFLLGAVVFVDDDDGRADPSDTARLRTLAAFAGGRVVRDLHDPALTHVVIPAGTDRRADLLAGFLPGDRVPRTVSDRWLLDSWSAKTRLPEEDFRI
ncbi:ATP dependent DNA ligase domain-containing protein [Dipodascopsis tothii]|uniref:ATP dependent DNA ligase domain-containing protein n=1 Tax=Dipodascopsis tothii TaxID=44089 RepID=UPI0034CFB5F6